jgi:hypothetical protein
VKPSGWSWEMIYSCQLTRKKNHGLTSATVEKRFSAGTRVTKYFFRTRRCLSWSNNWTCNMIESDQYHCQTSHEKNWPFHDTKMRPRVSTEGSKSMLNTIKRKYWSEFFRRPKNYIKTSIIASSEMGHHHTQQTSFRGGAKITWSTSFPKISGL